MKITLETKANNFSFDCQLGERILYAGLRQGLTLPYKCGTGTCGTCRARAKSGKVINTWKNGVKD